MSFMEIAISRLNRTPGSLVMAGQNVGQMLILRHFIHRKSDTVDIMGQVVNGVGEHFQTKQSCDPRSPKVNYF